MSRKEIQNSPQENYLVTGVLKQSLPSMARLTVKNTHLWQLKNSRPRGKINRVMAKTCSRPDCERGTRTHELCLFHRPRTQINTYKRPKREGKHAELWKVARAEWLEKHRPNHQGYYECYICGTWVEEANITLDHVQPRSSRQDLRYNMNNIQPCCWTCNSEKGSKH